VTIGAFEFNTADPTQSILNVSSVAVAYGGTATVTLQARGPFDSQMSRGGLTVTFALGTGTSGGTLGAVTDNLDGTYTATFTATAVGRARTLRATINGRAVTTPLPAVTVTPVPLTVTPTAGQSKAYGAVVPTLAYTASGFVNGDSASTLTGALGTTATAASPVG